LKKGGIPRSSDEVLTYVLEVLTKASLLASDLLVDPAREQVVEFIAEKLSDATSATNETGRLRVRSFQGFLRRIPGLEHLVRNDDLTLVSLLEERTDFTEVTAPSGGEFVFISYARADARFVDQIAQLLAKRDIVVWSDRWLRVGSEHSTVLEQKISDASCVLVIWSRTSIRSQWVRDEAEMALKLNKLVPVAIEQAIPPLGFRQVQVLDLSQWTGNTDDGGIEKLIEALHAHMKKRPA
jgi:TIR domain